jgi:hypothetical protein
MTYRVLAPLAVLFPTKKHACLWVSCGAFLFLGCSGPVPTHYVEISTGGDGAGSTGGRGSGGNASGGGSAAPDSGAAADFGPLGLACGDKTACPDGLICLGATGHALGDLVPAGGYCTGSCNNDGDCAAYAGAACVEFVPGDALTQYCAPPCTLGDDTACGNRGDVACWPLQIATGVNSGRVCLPLCNNDDQCPSGTVCDGVSNLCSNKAQGGGQSIGTDCDPSGADPCADGFCLDLGQPKGGVCSSYCRRGTFPQCGGSASEGLCAWVLEGDQAAGAADTGLCALRCRCDAECNNTSLRCEPHADLGGTAYPGVCSSISGPVDTDCTQ